MRFSIIIPTRNRPDLFAEALASVLAQDFDDYELIIVDDGSDVAHKPAYQMAFTQARDKLGERFQHHALIHRPNGHGPSYALNYGVSLARGDYVGFLDDDDVWLSRDHLTQADAALKIAGADVYMSNQRAFLRGEEVPEKLWLGPLAPRLRGEGRMPDAQGCYAVSRADLLATPGFAHLNTLIVRRAFYGQIDGMDETIRWEGDRDLFLRLIDAAGAMLHNPAETVRHNIPDAALAANMTTRITRLEKLLSQMRVVEKAATLASHPDVRAHGRRHRVYVLEKIAQELAAEADWAGAFSYARQAQAARPSPGRLAVALKYGWRWIST